MSKNFDIYNYGFKRIDQVTDEAIQRIKDFKEKKIYYLPTGFPRLNRKLMGGMYPRKYIVIGARPGMGKSAFVNQLIFDTLDLNKDRKIIVLYWNFEMPNVDQVDRMVSKTLRKDSYELYSIDTTLSDSSFIDYTKTVSDFRSYPVYFCEVPCTSKTIYEVNCKVSEQYPDYQIINILDHSRYVKKEDENDELKMLNNLSKSLHLVNVDTGAINILISQLNRDIEKDSRAKNMYKPLLSDLFGADSVGQDTQNYNQNGTN